MENPKIKEISKEICEHCTYLISAHEKEWDGFQCGVRMQNSKTNEIIIFWYYGNLK